MPEVPVWMAASHAGQRDCRISEADCGRGGEREPGVTACISGENEWPGVASGKGKAGIFKKDDISHMGHLIGAVCGFIFGYFIF